MYHDLGLVKEFNMNPITLKRWLVKIDKDTPKKQRCYQEEHQCSDFIRLQNNYQSVQDWEYV